MRTYFIWAVALSTAVTLISADLPATRLRGKLIQNGEKQLVIQTNDGARIRLEGDEPTMKVLHDERLHGDDFEVMGHRAPPDRFVVDEFHKHALWLHRNGKRLMVSYWCDVCYIRTSVPGKCACCQKYTDLDPTEGEP